MDTRNKKRITTGLGIAAAAAAALAVTAGTFASFSDAEAAPNQSITAGTLDLVADGTAVTAPINTSNAAPSNAGTGYKRLDLQNTGSLPGKLTVNVEKVGDLENGCNEPEGLVDTSCGPTDGGELDDHLIVVLLNSDQGTYLRSKVLTSWAGLAPIELGTLAPGATKTIYISTQVQPQAGNEVQSDSASFVVKADLNQS